MKHILLTTALMVPTLAQAQPFSESMADCASVHQIMAQIVHSDEAADVLMYGARQWHAAAVAQSAREGNSITAAAMWDVIDAKSDVTEAKGPMHVLSEEFRDWIDYCRSFAGNQGIDLTP